MDRELISRYLNDACRQYDVPGLACAVSRNGKVETFCVGLSDINSGTPVCDRSIFNIASIGKLITVACIFKLREQGKLELSSTLGQLLAGLPEIWNVVRIDHLLTHCSGIRNYTDTSDYWSECMLDVPKARILQYVENDSLQFVPGSRWTYSNTGFYLLGLIIEKLSGMDYFGFADQLISSAKPGLHLIKSDERLTDPLMVKGYTRIDKQISIPSYYSNSGTFAAGGFSACLSDFLVFEDALFGGALLSQRSVEQIMQPFIKDDGAILSSPEGEVPFEMTRGLFRFHKNGKILLAHRGEISGFTSEYIRIPERDLAIILSVNIDQTPGVFGLAERVLELAGSDHL